MYQGVIFTNIKVPFKYTKKFFQVLYKTASILLQNIKGYLLQCTEWEQALLYVPQQYITRTKHTILYGPLGSGLMNKKLDFFKNDNSLVQVRVIDLMKVGFPIQIQIQFQHNFEHMIK
jgi:hypothetical protein